jgi:hypothetical protein
MKSKIIIISLLSVVVLGGLTWFGVRHFCCAPTEEVAQEDCSKCGAAIAGTCPSMQKNEVALASETTGTEQKVVAYYFYTTQRCASCYKIETYSHEAIEKGFADAIKSGKLEWKMLNTDLPENKRFIEDYSLFTKSLVLVKEENGKQTSWKNCNKVWELLNNKEAFESYVQKEVRSYLGQG